MDQQHNQQVVVECCQKQCMSQEFKQPQKLVSKNMINSCKAQMKQNQQDDQQERILPITHTKKIKKSILTKKKKPSPPPPPLVQDPLRLSPVVKKIYSIGEIIILNQGSIRNYDSCHESLIMNSLYFSKITSISVNQQFLMLSLKRNLQNVLSQTYMLDRLKSLGDAQLKMVAENLATLIEENQQISKKIQKIMQKTGSALFWQRIEKTNQDNLQFFQRLLLTRFKGKKYITLCYINGIRGMRLDKIGVSSELLRSTGLKLSKLIITDYQKRGIIQFQRSYKNLLIHSSQHNHQMLAVPDQPKPHHFFNSHLSHDTQPTFQQSRIIEQDIQQQRLATLQRVVRKFYFFHLIAIAFCFTFLLIAEKRFIWSFTMLLLGIYCYMIFWNWIINFVLVICQKDTAAIIFNRVCIRFFIMMFFPLGIYAYFLQSCLGIPLVFFLTIYLTIISFLFIVYEIYGCTIGQQTNPPYIFEPNNLQKETNMVWQSRRQYNREVIEYERRQENNAIIIPISTRRSSNLSPFVSTIALPR